MHQFFKIAYHHYKRRLFPVTSKISNTLINTASQNSINVLIETGTYFGDTPYNTKNYFDAIYSIELSDTLASFAKKRFKNDSNINIIQGDSGKIFKQLLPTIKQRIIFWLDGHYSGGVTALGDNVAPIMDELNHIINHSIKDHIILIDDARLFDGTNGYPTIDEIDSLLKETPYGIFDINNDIIHIKPTHSNE